MKARHRILALLLAAAPSLAFTAVMLPGTLKEWHGEYFDKGQGAFFMSMQLSGFKITGSMNTNVQVYVTDILKKKAFIISEDPSSDPSTVAGQIWATSTGKYIIDQIVLVDGAGVKRTWSGAKAARTFAVKRQCLSNLGQWAIAPEGKDGLKVSFTMLPNRYRETGKKEESSVAAVLDGFTGLIQEQVGGKRVLLGAEGNYSNQHELRRSITITRQISMFYKLDLFRHNFHGKAIADVLNTYDPNLRKCYTDRLDFNDELRGDVHFTFLLSKQTGTMAKLKYTGGSANDPKLSECMYYELAHIQFPVPENMVGELIYTYDVK